MNFEFIHQGDIFNSGCMALVNPVNCKGVMGKGLAKEFKKRFPRNFQIYKDKCAEGHLQTGRILIHQENGHIIMNFPTKDDWRSPSEYHYIDSGMKFLATQLKFLPFITSIAIPPLGCGLGGLDWTIVCEGIKHGLLDVLGEDYPLNVKVYCP
jgi:O-acetyl-ADP-ribose deacetylase (regulator of RNase III)